MGSHVGVHDPPLVVLVFSGTRDRGGVLWAGCLQHPIAFSCFGSHLDHQWWFMYTGVIPCWYNSKIVLSQVVAFYKSVQSILQLQIFYLKRESF